MGKFKKEKVNGQKGKSKNPHWSREYAAEISSLPKSRTIMQRSMEAISEEMLQDVKKPEHIPKGVDLATHILIRKLFKVATRNNKDKISYKCKYCKKYSEVDGANLKAESNSTTANIALLDRLVAKEHLLKVKVSASAYSTMVYVFLMEAISKYVPENKLLEVQDEINANFKVLEEKGEEDGS